MTAEQWFWRGFEAAEKEEYDREKFIERFESFKRGVGGPGDVGRE